MTQRWVHVNPQYEMLPNIKQIVVCIAAGIFVLHKTKYTTTQIKYADPMLILSWADIV